MNRPKISIITPSFNQAEFIEETILSVINQDYDNLEYIIIDGGSTDGSVEIIKKYEDHIAYWCSEKDKGQTNAINKGFKVATGDLVAWMNSDDLFAPNSFEIIARAYERNPMIDVYYGDKVHIDRQGREQFVQRYAPYKIESFANDKMAFCNQAAYWKREIFDRIGFLDESIQFAMDYDYFVRMGHCELKFYHLPEILGKQRYYEGTKTSDQEWLEILNENRKLINRKYSLKSNWWLKLRCKLSRFVYYIMCGNLGYIFIKKEKGV